MSTLGNSTSNQNPNARAQHTAPGPDRILEQLKVIVSRHNEALEVIEHTLQENANIIGSSTVMSPLVSEISQTLRSVVAELYYRSMGQRLTELQSAFDEYRQGKDTNSNTPGNSKPRSTADTVTPKQSTRTGNTGSTNLILVESALPVTPSVPREVQATSGPTIKELVRLSMITLHPDYQDRSQDNIEINRYLQIITSERTRTFLYELCKNVKDVQSEAELTPLQIVALYHGQIEKLVRKYKLLGVTDREEKQDSLQNQIGNILGHTRLVTAYQAINERKQADDIKQKKQELDQYFNAYNFLRNIYLMILEQVNSRILEFTMITVYKDKHPPELVKQVVQAISPHFMLAGDLRTKDLDILLLFNSLAGKRQLGKLTKLFQQLASEIKVFYDNKEADDKTFLTNLSTCNRSFRELLDTVKDIEAKQKAKSTDKHAWFVRKVKLISERFR